MSFSGYSSSNINAIRVVSDTDADTTAEVVSTSAVTLYAMAVAYPATSGGAFFKAYDNVAPVLGTTHPDLIIFIQDGGSSSDPDYAFYHFGTTGITFSNGLSFIGSDAAGSGTGSNPGANLVVTLFTS